jgi:hypothetical protein
MWGEGCVALFLIEFQQLLACIILGRRLCRPKSTQQHRETAPAPWGVSFWEAVL